MRTAVLGLGLIGGSLARALQPLHDVVGHDTDADVRRAAADAGLAVADDAAAAVEDADLVVLAAPVAANDRLLALVPPGRVVTDVGGVKAPVVQAWHALAEPAALVPGHPMAGAETAGWSAARPDLFQGARWVLCPGPWASPRQWLDVCELVLAVGAEVVPAEPGRHDLAAAAISHAPHLVAAAVAASADASPDARLARSLAAGSFRDLTRVTASPPRRTADFCLANRGAGAAVLRDVAARLSAAADSLEAADRVEVTAALEAGHAARSRLDRAQAGGTPGQVEVRLDDDAWAERLHALADAGAVVVGVRPHATGGVLDVRSPA